MLVKKYHPDLNPGKEDLNAKFKEVSSAYQFIGSPEAREKFDKGETSEQQQEKYQEQSKSYYNTQQNNGRYSQKTGSTGLTIGQLISITKTKKKSSK